jgi:hypothetical protein
MILGIMVLSVVVFANEADGAGLVWRAVSKLGSLVSDLGDVAGGCSNGQIMEYQTSNSTWICGTDDTGSGGFTTISSEISPTGNATVLAQNSTGTRASFKTISAGTGIQVNNGSQSVIISSTVIDTDTTVISSISNTNATLIADNSTSTNNVRLKGISAGTGIQIDNGTNTIIIDSTITQGFTTIASELATSNNATLIGENSTNNRAVIKTLSAGTGITLTNNTNSVQINVTNGINLLTGNLTTSAGGTDYTQVFRIPLTENSGNSVYGQLIATSATNQIAIQAAANITNPNTGGFCFFRTGTTTGTTAPAIDNFSLNSSSITLDTAEPTYNAVANLPIPIFFDCTLTTSSTPGDLRIFFQPETTGTAVSIKKGSWYIKTP